jgi:hypothetical protein
MYWSGLQQDVGDKEMLMEGAEQLKHDVAVYSTQTKADSRQLLLANVASCYLSSWLCFALCGLIFFSSLVLVGSTLVRLFSGVRFLPHSVCFDGERTASFSPIPELPIVTE